jgi:hypothetical protein
VYGLKQTDSHQSFWWRDCLKLLPKFKSLAICSIHNGSTTLLWEDDWNGQVLKNQYPHLASYASNLQISSRIALQNHNFLSMFDLPLSNEAYDEYHELEQLLNLHLDDTGHDSWTYQ